MARLCSGATEQLILDRAENADMITKLESPVTLQLALFDLKSTRSPLEWHESEAWSWQGVGPLTKVIHSDGVLSSLGAGVLRLSLQRILRAPSRE